jgi:hypothetical protein
MNLDFQSSLNNAVKIMNAQQEEITKSIIEKNNERERRYQEKVSREKQMVELLKAIDKNTSVIPDMLKLLEQSNDYQQQILDFMYDLNTIATIKNKTRAKQMYENVMFKIKNGISDINTFATLWNYGETIGKILKTLGII